MNRSAIAAYTIAVGLGLTQPAWSVALLYNPGPVHMAARVLITDPDTGQPACGPGTGLADADAVNLPERLCPEGYNCAGGLHVPRSPQGSCASYYIDARAWTPLEIGKNPGWAAVPEQADDTIIYHYRNDAGDSDDPCKLREVGIVYHGGVGHQVNAHLRLGPDDGPFHMGDFSRVVASFSASLDRPASTARCSSAPTAYISADLHIGYPKRSDPTRLVAQQLLGVMVYGMSGRDTQGKESTSPVFWTGEANGVRRLLLHGDAVDGVHQDAVITTVDSKFHTLTINYKPLFREWLPPPEGYTLDDAVITGLDIYSSVRGADLDFRMENVDLEGYP